MDLRETIRLLKIEKEKIERAIAAMENFLASGQNDPVRNKPGRGRKSMPPEERLEVSKRMKKYWESRRKRREE